MTTAHPFVGRRQELDHLQRHLTAVVDSGGGRLLSVRGRRQAGKSRLVTEFVDRTALPQLFFTASRLATAREELARFAVDAARRSTLPGRRLFEDVAFDTWDAALHLLAAALPDEPSVVVLDEFPWLTQSSPSLEGTLQALWDRVFEPKPVLFVLIGSDLTMMEALTAYDRPLFGRAKEMVVEPFTPADTAAMAGVGDSAAVALDAQLVTGGYPRLCLEWRDAADAMSFVRTQLTDENSDLVVVGRNVLAAEFPADLQARHVLAAIGSGERTNKGVATRAGLQAAPLARSLRLLQDAKRVVTVETPVSTRPAREPRYRIADPYLRFWLRFIEPSLPDIARGRPDLAFRRVRESWTEYRGRAVEPLVREALERLAGEDPRLGGAATVGGYWTRTGDVEVDLVGVDRLPEPRRVAFVGSVKWRERSPFNRHDLARLIVQRAAVPGGADTALVAVSRSGCTVEDIDAAYGPEDLMAAWR